VRFGLESGSLRLSPQDEPPTVPALSHAECDASYERPTKTAFPKTPTNVQLTSERTSSDPFRGPNSAWNWAKQILNGQAVVLIRFHPVGALSGVRAIALCAPLVRRESDRPRGAGPSLLLPVPCGRPHRCAGDARIHAKEEV
jgi:hypothetical protein